MMMMGRDRYAAGDRDRDGDGEEEEEDERSETSSIGACSSSESEQGEEEEKKKSNKSSLTSLESMEDALPFKKGLSSFYSGKSKSFTSLSHAASSSSVKDLVKPDNPFNKRRRLQLLSRNYRRASCTSLASIDASHLPPPHLLLSECIREDAEDKSDASDAEDEDASPPPSSSTPHLLQRRRPSLFTVAVSVSPPQPDPTPLLTPKPLLTHKLSMPRRPPARSFSLSDLSQHHHPHLHLHLH